MSSIVNIPFNHEPVGLNFKNNASYTVPAGKYARVVANIECSIYVTDAVNNSNTTRYPSPSMADKTREVELWLPSGTVLASSKTNASGKITSGNAQPANAGIYFSNYSEVLLTVDGNTIKKVRAHGTIGGEGDAASQIIDQSWAGHTDVSFHIEEYNSIS